MDKKQQNKQKQKKRNKKKKNGSVLHQESTQKGTDTIDTESGDWAARKMQRYQAKNPGTYALKSNKT